MSHPARAKGSANTSMKESTNFRGLSFNEIVVY